MVFFTTLQAAHRSTLHEGGFFLDGAVSFLYTSPLHPEKTHGKGHLGQDHKERLGQSPHTMSPILLYLIFTPMIDAPGMF